MIKLNRTFTISAGGATSILLDFVGDRSITQTGTGSGNANGGHRGCNGSEKGKGKGNSSCGDGGDDGGETLDAGTFTMHPVITVVSVEG